VANVYIISTSIDDTGFMQSTTELRRRQGNACLSSRSSVHAKSSVCSLSRVVNWVRFLSRVGIGGSRTGWRHDHHRSGGRLPRPKGDPRISAEAWWHRRPHRSSRCLAGSRAPGGEGCAGVPGGPAGPNPPGPATHGAHDRASPVAVRVVPASRPRKTLPPCAQRTIIRTWRRPRAPVRPAHSRTGARAASRGSSGHVHRAGDAVRVLGGAGPPPRRSRGPPVRGPGCPTCR